MQAAAIPSQLSKTTHKGHASDLEGVPVAIAQSCLQWRAAALIATSSGQPQTIPKAIFQSQKIDIGNAGKGAATRQDHESLTFQGNDLLSVS